MSDVSFEGVPKVLVKPDEFARETDFRFQEFLSWARKHDGKRIGVYGTGANAKRILSNAETFSHIVVVDDNAVGAVVCGRIAVKLEDAFRDELDSIVIAAEFQSALVIARRIKRACRHKGIPLYDMYGNDIETLQTKLADVLTKPLNEQLALLDACEVWCLDVNVFLDDVDKSKNAINPCNASRIDQSIISLVDYAIAQGKDVMICCTDPCVQREEIIQMLESRGLTSGLKLLLGSEVGLYAQNGLYRILYEIAQDKRIVHVGQDVMTDALIPLAYGREAILTWRLRVDPDFYRPHGIEVEARSDIEWFFSGKEGHSDSPEGRLSTCAANILPSIEKECGRGAAQVVSFVAPLIVGFVTWLVNRLSLCEGAFDGVLFASRDGYLVWEAYNRYCMLEGAHSLPPARYFFTSRKASLAGMESKEANGAAYRSYLEYLASCGLHAGRDYAFVEFVGGGTCQKQLEAFVPFRLHGLCFGSRVGDSLSQRLGAEYYFDDEDASFFSRYLHLESYVSSAEPSLVGFESDGVPVYAEELRTKDEITFLRKVHAGVMLFVDEYFTSWHKQGDVIDHEFVNDIMPGIDQCNSRMITLYDDMTGNVQDKDIWSIISQGEDNALKASSISETGKDACAKDRMKEKHDGLLELLAAFDIVCQEFGLTYIATHGTLLGAVRHGGFVPRDDDLDVAMPRKDYEEFLELAAAGVFPKQMFVQTPENDEHVFYGGFAKLRFQSDGLDDGDDGYRSAWMDIMPLDNCSRNDTAVQRKQRVIRQWQRALYVKTYGFDLGKLWDVSPRNLSVYFRMADAMDRSTLCKLLKWSCMSSKPSGLLTVFAGNYRLQKNKVRFDLDDVKRAYRVTFEDTTIPIPQNAGRWLEKHYGPEWSDIPMSADGEE